MLAQLHMLSVKLAVVDSDVETYDRVDIMHANTLAYLSDIQCLKEYTSIQYLCSALAL